MSELSADYERVTDLAQKLAERLIETLDYATRADVEIPVRAFGEGGPLVLIIVRIGA